MKLTPIQHIKPFVFIVFFVVALPVVGIPFVLTMIGIRLFQDHQKRQPPKVIATPQFDAYLTSWKAANGYV